MLQYSNRQVKWDCSSEKKLDSKDMASEVSVDLKTIYNVMKLYSEDKFSQP